LLLLLLSFLPVAGLGAAEAPTEVGWLQSIRLEPYRVRVTARVDTGAKSSSIHAEDVERFTRNGVERVRFSLYKEHDEQQGPKLTYDLPVKRLVRIKRDDDLPPDERVTVMLAFCIAGQVMRAEFNLNDRSNLHYPVLLGRRFLAGHFVVNPAETFVLGYACPEAD
jgi:hypothetical protein